MFKSIFKIEFPSNLYVKGYNSGIVGFDHSNKNMSHVYWGKNLNDKTKFLIDVALQIIMIIIMLLK